MVTTQCEDALYNLMILSLEICYVHKCRTFDELDLFVVVNSLGHCCPNQLHLCILWQPYVHPTPLQSWKYEILSQINPIPHALATMISRAHIHPCTRHLHVCPPCPCWQPPAPMVCHYIAHAMLATSLGFSPTIPTYLLHLSRHPTSMFVPRRSSRVCFGREPLACGPYILDYLFLVYG